MGERWVAEHELEVAREDIVATSVEPTSEEAYMALYETSATTYGFGPDWYILAAVGEVESNHGQAMGPSSAGAMGPMQFMPTTWETSGVDGNGDGVANVMDPEDAIPAAASYLQDGGAPQDWYRALYSYNHADWYVKKVLAVAEAYRRLAKRRERRPVHLGCCEDMTRSFLTVRLQATGFRLRAFRALCTKTGWQPFSSISCRDDIRGRHGLGIRLTLLAALLVSGFALAGPRAVAGFRVGKEAVEGVSREGR